MQTCLWCFETQVDAQGPTLYFRVSQAAYNLELSDFKWVIDSRRWDSKSLPDFPSKKQDLSRQILHLIWWVLFFSNFQLSLARRLLPSKTSYCTPLILSSINFLEWQDDDNISEMDLIYVDDFSSTITLALPIITRQQSQTFFVDLTIIFLCVLVTQKVTLTNNLCNLCNTTDRTDPLLQTLYNFPQKTFPNKQGGEKW